jgi:copper(I)-binding protein
MNSIKRLGLSLSTALALTFSLMVNVAADGIADKILVNDPYVRAVPPVVKTSAAFMQFQNSGEAEQFLVSASTPAAAAVELHMHTMDDGVMRMRQIAHIHLPPKQTVALQPGGLHIMLFDLTAPLNLGERVPITLTFEDGSTKQISAEVRSVKQMMKH